jgi:UDP-N-acetylglucosamine--N-acetylmuramyl-(pentapeptide) pyrophosphoryl-undecaprenol N-acetylglucosamine transferase
MSLQPLKIVISGGGTGGHIFPAIAIADAIRAKSPDSQILFVGAKGRMEMVRVPESGYAIMGLWISGFQRKLTLDNFAFPFKLISSLYKARRILKDFKPDVVVGVGGYASGPTLRMAIMLGIKTLIQEQNSFPGITNRLLGKKADRICVAYESMDKWFPAHKTILTGNPLRKTTINIEGRRKEALSFFNLNENSPVVLIVGGSQGARAMNEAIAESIKKLRDSSLQIIWQTGQNYFNTANEVVEQNEAESFIHPFDFINRMDLAYAAADMIVSRAGAMSIAEIAMVRKPAIFVPLPTAAEDHQTKNALRLVDKNAALLVKNSEASKSLADEIIQLAFNEDLRKGLSINIGQFAKAGATEMIVNEIFKLAGR